MNEVVLVFIRFVQNIKFFQTDVSFTHLRQHWWLCFHQVLYQPISFFRRSVTTIRRLYTLWAHFFFTYSVLSVGYLGYLGYLCYRRAVRQTSVCGVIFYLRMQYYFAVYDANVTETRLNNVPPPILSLDFIFFVLFTRS